MTRNQKGTTAPRLKKKEAKPSSSHGREQAVSAAKAPKAKKSKKYQSINLVKKTTKKKEKPPSRQSVRNAWNGAPTAAKKPKLNPKSKPKRGPPTRSPKKQASSKLPQEPQLPPMNKSSTAPGKEPVPWLAGETNGGTLRGSPRSPAQVPPRRSVADLLGQGGLPTDGIDPISMQRLDDELRCLERFVRLTPDEVAARYHVVRCVEETAARRLPNAQIRAFGSFATPAVCCYTSDVDLAITGVVEVQYQGERKRKRRTASPPPAVASGSSGGATASELDEQSKEERLRRWRRALDAMDRASESTSAVPASKSAPVDEPQRKGSTLCPPRADENTAAVVADEERSVATQPRKRTKAALNNAGDNTGIVGAGDKESVGADDHVPVQNSRTFTLGGVSLRPSAGTIPEPDRQRATDSASFEHTADNEECTVPTCGDADERSLKLEDDPPSNSARASQGDSHSCPETAASFSDDEASSAEGTEESDQDFADKLLPLQTRRRSSGPLGDNAVTLQDPELGELGGPRGSSRSPSPLLFTICRTGASSLDSHAEKSATADASREFSAASTDTEDGSESFDDAVSDNLVVSMTTESARQNQQSNQVSRATRDLCISTLKRIKSKLSDRFCKGLRGRNGCQLIQARVPILKLELPACEVDIAIDGCTGADTSLYACSQSKRFESFATVVLFLKVLLSQQKLDTPFNGGIGSYKLYVLVAYHIERHLAQGGADRPGEVLLSMLFRYGGVKTSYSGGKVHSIFRTTLTLRSYVECDGGSADLSNAFQLPQCLRLFESCWHRIRARLQGIRRDGVRPLSLLDHVIDALQLRRDREHRIRMSQWTLAQYATKNAANVALKATTVPSSPRALPVSFGPPTHPPLDRTADELLAGYNVGRSFLWHERGHSDDPTPRRSNKCVRNGISVLA